MRTKTERLELLLTAEQKAKLRREAAARGCSMATILREFIDSLEWAWIDTPAPPASPDIGGRA